MEVEAQQRVQQGGQSRFGPGLPWAERVPPVNPGSGPVTGSSIDVLSRAAYQLLARARQLSSGNATDRQLALIFAMSACDLHMEQALMTLLKLKGSRLKDVSALVGHSNTLASQRVRKVYASLTHDMPWGDASLAQPAAAWWHDWLSDRDLKHATARDGSLVSQYQAARCIKTCVSFVAHVSVAVSRALERL